MKFKQIFQKTAQVIVPLLLGLILLWYLYRNQDPSRIAEIIKDGSNYGILAFSLLFGLSGNIVRGVRWSLLIDSLGRKINRRNAIFAVLGNYAINLAIPFRAGEIWRCGVISRHEKIPFAKLLGTLFVDRIMDTIVVALLTMCLFVFNIGFFKKFFSENPPIIIETLYNIFSSAWTYAALAGLLLITWLVFAKLRHKAFMQPVRAVLINIWEGIKSLWTMEHKSRFFIQTILIWVCYFLYFYVTFHAFDFTDNLGVRIGLIAFAMSSIGVAVPVQGGIGVWHFMVIYTLAAFGVDKTDAGAFAFVVFAIQSIWVVITGIFGIVTLSFSGKKRIYK
jgi:uncharacterized protein (TIRG00374 family)